MVDPILLIAAFGTLAFVVMSLILLKMFLYICRPNEIIVFSGRRRRLADGSSVGFSILQHGSRFRVPVIETAQRMAVSTMTVHINISNAYSRGNIPLTVSAIANVKIATRPGLLENAIERFLGRDREEVRRVAKETIEGSLRGALAKLTPEQVNEDRLSFVEALGDEAEDDLRKIGIQMDTLKIQSVTDEVEYLDSIGRERIAQIVRDAEVAESDNEREAERAIAEADGRGRVAQENAQSKIQSQENDLRRVIAELDAKARSEEERTVAAAEEARARAEVKLQEIRTELERLRLTADEVLPAEADREAAQLIAAGQAAAIGAEGRAAAEALQFMSEAWQRAGDNAEDIFIIQNLEPLLRRIVERVGNIDIDHINLVDSGDGASIGHLAGAYPATINRVLDSLSESTGLPIRDVLARPAKPVDETRRREAIARNAERQNKREKAKTLIEKKQDLSESSDIPVGEEVEVPAASSTRQTAQNKPVSPKPAQTARTATPGPAADAGARPSTPSGPNSTVRLGVSSIRKAAEDDDASSDDDNNNAN